MNNEASTQSSESTTSDSFLPRHTHRRGPRWLCGTSICFFLLQFQSSSASICFAQTQGAACTVTSCAKETGQLVLIEADGGIARSPMTLGGVPAASLQVCGCRSEEPAHW
mmetsp:Transcript_61360/g.164815  ORF Transcript_61360/g.164815 Transcript_61360/m.164815 type:complete len:110 (-) Transcript_61360:579-908(-)